MNQDQIKGKAKDLAGKVQQKTGELTGSKEQQAKGLGNQVKGKAEETKGDVKNVIKKDTND
jgi:uncharacterized protein YjbJ (UPF0337 family)